MRQRFKLRKLIANKDIENVLKLLEIENDKKIMDYGTGIGSYAIKASELMNNKGFIPAEFFWIFCSQPIANIICLGCNVHHNKENWLLLEQLKLLSILLPSLNSSR